MTYNEFMRQFNDYIAFKLEWEINKFGTAKEAAKHFDTSESTISRLKNHIGKPDRASVLKICGEDIYDQDICSVDDLKIEYYEKEFYFYRLCYCTYHTLY